MRPLQVNPDKITRVILAVCILHNFIRNNKSYNVPELIESTVGTTQEEASRLQDFPRCREAFNFREQFKQFFNYSPEGSLEYQERRAFMI